MDSAVGLILRILYHNQGDGTFLEIAEAAGVDDPHWSMAAGAIDYDSDFVWIEDGIGARDLATLEAHNARDRFYLSNGLDPDVLLKFMEFTRERMGLPEITDWGPNWESFFTQPRALEDI